MNAATDPAPRRFLAGTAAAGILDLGLFFALVATGNEPHLARLASVACAAVAGFLIHRRFAFAGFRGAKMPQGGPVPFATLQATGAVLDYGVFARILYSLPHPVGMGGLVFALLAGTAAGAAFNYLLLRKLLPAAPAGVSTPGMATAPTRRIRYKRLALWALMACIALQMARAHFQAVLSFPKLAYPLGPPDPDVWLFLSQTRQWMTEMGQSAAGFFDHVVPGTNAPLGGVTSAWTRPMELLLALAAGLMPHDLSLDVRLMLGASWLAPALGLAAVAALAWGLRRQIDSLHAAGFAGLLMLFNPDTYNYYVPGNADHHGLLSTLWCAALALLLCRPQNDKTALALGGVLGLMVWVSPEALMLVAAVYALFGAEAVVFRDRAAAAGRALAATAFGAALAATAGLFVEMPAGTFFAAPIAYDTLSIVYVLLLWLCAAAGGALMLLYRRPGGFSRRFFAGVAAGGAVLAVMKMTYPKFFLGPLVDMDPFIETGFLPTIGEAMPLLKAGRDDIVRELAEPFGAAVLLLLTFWRRKLRPVRVERLLIVASLLAVTTGLALWRIRWGYYMHPCAIAAIGLTLAPLTVRPRRGPGLALVRAASAVPRAAWPYLALWAGFIAMNVIIRSMPAGTPVQASSDCLSQLRFAVQSGQLQPLLGAEPLTLLVTGDAGGDVQYFTPYRIIASNYFREGLGLRDLHEILAARNAAAARPLLRARKVAALLYCPADAHIADEHSWLMSVSARKHPAWLVPRADLQPFVLPGDKSPPQSSLPLLFRVKP